MAVIDMPVCIGGVGGSGTRLVSEIFQNAGLFFGDDQNNARDTLIFTLFFNIQALKLSGDCFKNRAEFFRRCLLRHPVRQGDVERLMKLANQNQLQQSNSWMIRRVQRIVNAQNVPFMGRWGWKSPPTHLFAKKFIECWSGLRFVFVYRDAYDMALSKNQNQLKYWAPHLCDFQITGWRAKVRSLEFWAYAHEKLVGLKQQYPSRVFILSFEELCANPRLLIQRLLEFSETPLSNTEVRRLSDLPRMPSSVGRGERLRRGVSDDLRRRIGHINKCLYEKSK